MTPKPSYEFLEAALELKRDELLAERRELSARIKRDSYLEKRIVQLEHYVGALEARLGVTHG